ncbi:MAG: protein kinase [Planctomycetota bacterium]
MGSIVCVEASAEQGSWISGILEQRGHTVTRVQGEAEAAPLLDSPTDLWVIDGDLSGSALRLVARLRKLGSAEQLPILFVAARDTEDAVLRAHAAGANAVLTPPLSRAQLIVRVKRLLDGRVPRAPETPLELAKGDLYCGRYRITSGLGRGGNAVVFKAHDERTGQTVALKVAQGQSRALPESRQRLQREAYSLLAVDCAHTPQLVEFGRHEGREFMVLELIDGTTVWDWVAKRGPFSPDDAFNLLMGLTLALDSLQAHGMVHRDLKPGNVILRDDQPAWPVLVDFGLARNPAQDFLTDPDVLVGTAGYMAPEYVLGRPIDFRSDLFSLGHVVRFAVTGQQAWPELSGFKLLQRLAQETYEIPSTVPRELREILQVLVQVDPNKRPPSAAALLNMLGAGPRMEDPTKRASRAIEEPSTACLASQPWERA